MEHREWVGPLFETEAIEGQKIAIVGYSHYEEDDDYEGLTEKVVLDVIGGARYQFFRSIMSYFGHDDAADFWNRVVFFNFVPESVGASDELRKSATPDQREAGRKRVFRILGDHKPDKLIVFTKKGWDAFPKYTGSQVKEDTRFHPSPYSLGWGTYADESGHEVTAFGLHHPERKPATEMRDIVASALRHTSWRSSGATAAAK